MLKNPLRKHIKTIVGVFRTLLFIKDWPSSSNYVYVSTLVLAFVLACFIIDGEELCERRNQ